MFTTRKNKTRRFANEMDGFRTGINKHLKEVVNMISPSEGIGSEDVSRAIKYCMCVEDSYGPKRIRPMLVLLVIKALGMEINVAHQTVACALEIAHIASLIHDDLPGVDNSDFRHGKKALHVASPDIGWGVGLAIHVGAGLEYDLFRLLSDRQLLKSFSTKQMISVIAEISMALGCSGVMQGQVADLKTAGRTRTPSDIANIRDKKTGMLIRACMATGCILGRATHMQRLALDFYGRCLGDVWQLRDDALDIESSPEKLGKPTKLDSANKQATYASLCGIEQTQRLIDELVTRAHKSIVVAKLKDPSRLIALIDWAAIRDR